MAIRRIRSDKHQPMTTTKISEYPLLMIALGLPTLKDLQPLTKTAFTTHTREPFVRHPTVLKIKVSFGFVTNGSFIDGNADDGLRKCLSDESSTIYCFNLRGNQRTSGELLHRRAGKSLAQEAEHP